MQITSNDRGGAIDIFGRLPMGEKDFALELLLMRSEAEHNEKRAMGFIKFNTQSLHQVHKKVSSNIIGQNNTVAQPEAKVFGDTVISAHVVMTFYKK